MTNLISHMWMKRPLGLVFAALLSGVAAQPLTLDAAVLGALLLMLLGCWGVCVAPGLFLLRVRREVAAGFGGGFAFVLLVLAVGGLEPLVATALPALAAATLSWFKPAWRRTILALYAVGIAALLLVAALAVVMATADAKLLSARWLHWRLALGTLGALLLAATGAAQWLLTTVAARRVRG